MTMAPVTQSVSVWLPLRTRNPGNLRPTNSQLAAILLRKEHTEQHNVACLLTRNAMIAASVAPHQLLPCVVTLTRFSAGKLDAHDGLRSACKYCVDGIAQALGIDDGRGPVQWQYAQQKCKPKQFGIRVHIQKATP